MSGSHSVAEPSMVFPCWNLLLEPSSIHMLSLRTRCHTGNIYVQFQGVSPKNVIFSIGPRQEQESQIFYWILAHCACTSMLEPSLYLIVTWYLKFKQVNRNKRQPQVILLLYKLSCFDDVSFVNSQTRCLQCLINLYLQLRY